jgi:decaprenylphospho-beta-D-erythro-pentofuranosid-2-ulose 2-reductase
MRRSRRPWERAIIVGASSGIGAALAPRLAGAGCRVALLARREPELTRLADAINRGAPASAPSPLARSYVHDVTRPAEVPSLFERVVRDLGGLDLVIYAAGVMPAVGESEYSLEKDRHTVEVNLLGAIAWLNQAAVHFARARAGTIVGISSVAGDRGRRGNPAYCASKAALDAYLEALRHRLARSRVAVVTAKPGPVDTRLSAGVRRRPFLISADRAARQILAAAHRGTPVAYVPGVWRPIMFAVRSLPHALFARLDL